MKKMLMLIAIAFMGLNSVAQEEIKIDTSKLVDVNMLQGEQTIKLDQIVLISMHNHTSVGYESEVYARKYDLKLIKTELIYSNVTEPMESGGDKGVKNYYFKPTKQGEFEIVCKSLYRGQVENEFNIKIIVK